MHLFNNVYLIIIYLVRCQFSVPKNPKCPDPVLSERTSSTISINLTAFEANNSEGHLCVKVKPKKDELCKIENDSLVDFDGLNSSTQYNFSVFSYFNKSDGEPLLSISSCPLSYYTCKYHLLYFS